MDVAIVTGGSSGVGAATVSRLRARGVSVVSVDLQLGDQATGGFEPVQGDVADVRTWERALEAAADLGGAPNMLVVNAAKLAVGTVLDLDVDDVRSVLEVNVIGAVRALKACLPPMIERGGGSVVTVASTAALLAEQDLAAYCASKGALLQLTRCVAVDHARAGIRANCVCPGAVNTPFFRQHVEAAADPESFLSAKRQRHPSGEILEPDQVAGVIDFLLSPAASGMNGASLTIDGGLLASFDFQDTAALPGTSSGESANAHSAMRGSR